MMMKKICEGRVPIDFMTPISWNRSMIDMMSVLAMEKMMVMKKIE